MVRDRVARRNGLAVLVATVTLLSSGCTPMAAAEKTQSSAGAQNSHVAPENCAPCTPVAPAVPPGGSPARRDTAPGLRVGKLFAGEDLVYATQGFTSAEVIALSRRVRGPVTPVYSSEQMVASGSAGFPDIAVDVMVANPVKYATAAGDPGLAATMSTGLVLAREEARLRKVGVGGRVTFADGRSAAVTAVVDAHLIGGHEMATAPRVRPAPSAATAEYLLVAGAANVASLTAAAHRAWPTRTFRVKDHTVNGYMSSADTVLTQLQTKLLFGEFSSRPAGAGTFVPDPSWVDKHLSTRRIVQLGDVTCNVAVIHDLAAAMQEITDRHLGSLIHTADFQYEGGCWSPRAARAKISGTLSSHSWGVAVDINVNVNPLGASPHQDARLVAIMAAHNFAWGGHFLRPDGAHFQWVGRGLLR